MECGAIPECSQTVDRVLLWVKYIKAFIGVDDQQKITLQEHGPKLQAFLDREYGAGKCRILVFGRRLSTEPIWKSCGNAEKTLFIYFDDVADQYFPIRSISKFLGKELWAICKNVFFMESI